MTNWRDKTCEKCVFRVEGECRRFPPAILHSLSISMANAYHPRYVFVVQSGHHDKSKNGKFIGACAEYAEQQEPKPPCPCNQPTATDISGTPYCVACGAKH